MDVRRLPSRCTHCGLFTRRLSRGRCAACYLYWLRRGRERPLDAAGLTPCIHCGYRRARGGGRCPSCYLS